MKKGDIIKNPFVRQSFNGNPNPNYALLYLSEDAHNYIVLTFEGKRARFCKDRNHPFEVIGHIDLFKDLFAKYYESAESEEKK